MSPLRLLPSPRPHLPSSKWTREQLLKSLEVIIPLGFIPVPDAFPPCRYWALSLLPCPQSCLPPLPLPDQTPLSFLPRRESMLLRTMPSPRSGHESPVPPRKLPSPITPSTTSSHRPRPPNSTGPPISHPPLIFALNRPRTASSERILSFSPHVPRRLLSYRLLYPSEDREGARSTLLHSKSCTTSTTNMAACSSILVMLDSGPPIPPPTGSTGTWPILLHQTHPITNMVV